MSDLAFATQTSLYYSISSHCLCLALLNVTLPLQNSTVICLRHASPCFAIADLHLVSHRHRYTELDRNVHCLCSSLLNDALPLLSCSLLCYAIAEPGTATPHITFARLCFALARPYPTQLDRNIHCHRLAVLHHGRAKQCPCCSLLCLAMASLDQASPLQNLEALVST